MTTSSRVLLLGRRHVERRRTLDGGQGNDELAGAGGADTLRGGPGNDLLGSLDFTDAGGENTVELGNDQLFGGEGDDVLLAGPGDDLLFGDAGWDHLRGDLGDDFLLFPVRVTTWSTETAGRTRSVTATLVVR